MVLMIILKNKNKGKIEHINILSNCFIIYYSNSIILKNNKMAEHYIIKTTSVPNQDKYHLYKSLDNANKFINSKLKEKFDECRTHLQKILSTDPVVSFNLSGEIVNALTTLTPTDKEFAKELDKDSVLYKITYTRESTYNSDHSWVTFDDDYGEDNDEDQTEYIQMYEMKNRLNLKYYVVEIKWSEFLKRCEPAFSYITDLTVLEIENEPPNDKFNYLKDTWKKVKCDLLMRIYNNIFDIEKVAWDLHNISTLINRCAGVKYYSFYYKIIKTIIADE